MLRLLLMITVLIWGTTLTFAQVDTNYIEKIPDAYVLAPHMTLKKLKVSFDTDASAGVTFQNHNFGAGIRFKRKKIGVSLSFPIIAYNESKFGKPRAYGFGFNIYPSYLYLQGNVRYLNGFDNLDATGTENDPVFRPKDDMIYINITGHYAFNHRCYSMRSAFKMLNRQKRSAGSWIVAVPLNYQRFSSDSLRLPLRDQENFRLDVYRSFKTGINGGYGYSYVLGHWSLNSLATGGVEFRNLKYKNVEGDNLRNQLRISPRVQLTGSITYNSRAFFGGIVGRYLPGLDITDGLNTRVESWSLRLMVGRRLVK